MSKVAIADVSITVSLKRCLLDMPYEILFEIFRNLPKGTLIKILRLCSKFRHIAGDTRFWKDVCIRYKPYEEPTLEKFSFEELYSEPWPVKVVDLSGTRIKLPVSSETDQLVKVTKLNLSFIAANKVTMEAILAKYQCTELYLNYNRIDIQGHIMGISPEAFSKQTALEVLSLECVDNGHLDYEMKTRFCIPSHKWLVPILNNCKNLKTLNLSCNYFTNSNMLGFVENLPTSLEKLDLRTYYHEPEDSFFGLLALSTPNLREIVLFSTNTVKCPSLLKFNFLETLQVMPNVKQDVSDLYMYIKNFPALKTVIIYNRDNVTSLLQFKKLRKTLEPHGIVVNQKECWVERPYPKDENLWEVSKAV